MYIPCITEAGRHPLEDSTVTEGAFSYWIVCLDLEHSPCCSFVLSICKVNSWLGWVFGESAKDSLLGRSSPLSCKADNVRVEMQEGFVIGAIVQ